MQFNTLTDWLKWIQSLHVVDMDLSLERVAEVARRLNVHKAPCTVITVAGTNGKGSCVAGLETIYMAAGYRVGAFTSPILFRHNEYVRVQGQSAADELFCEAFARVQAVLGEITLTPFEFNTLAAFDIFQRSHLDVWILEVGLGGRYDATNVIDADVAVVTSIGIDHVEWLGDTREKIAYEKAGIFRHNKPAVCGDFDPPKTLIDYAVEIGALLYRQQYDFGFIKQEKEWIWWSDNNRMGHLPMPKLLLQNMSTVLKVIELLQDKLPVSPEFIQKGLEKINLPGRLQVFPGEITQIFDVSHNPAAAEILLTWLNEHSCHGKTRAVFSMLADKDIVMTIQIVKPVVDQWFIAPLSGPRAASIEKLQACFRQAEVDVVYSYQTISEAYQLAIEQSQPGDRVVVFGSFHTVAEAAKQAQSSC